MPAPRDLKQGDIFWLPDCPAIEGDQLKKRPVIVVFTPSSLQQEEAIVVAVSTSVLESETDRISLPNRSNEPQTKSGLRKVCWAVPRWYFPIKPERLTDYCGRLVGRKLTEVVGAVAKRMNE